MTLPAEYLINGFNGRVFVMADPSMTSGARAAAVFYDRPMRMDAFAPYPPDLHDVKLKKDSCVLTVAAARACNPPCGAIEYCGQGNVCKPAAAVVSAGSISVDGASTTVTLVPTNSTYVGTSFPLASITSSVTISVRAAGGAMSAFAISSAGVDSAGIGLPAGGSEFALIDGQDKVITWSATENGIVQLLLNSGWHGAPPTATLLCEAPASAGRLVIPRAVVEAYPLASSVGMSHTSTVLLLQRKTAVVNASTVELLIIGYRGVIFPSH